jgi:hypothetical protein
MKKTEYHSYNGNVAVLRNGNTVRIIDGKGQKLTVRDLDGNMNECYYDDLKFVMEG